MTGAPQIKICGVTRAEDVERCVDLGVEVIGLNFWPGSLRFLGHDAAEALVSRVANRARVVGVFVNASIEEILSVRNKTGIERVQLHGDEPDSVLSALLPDAYRAIRLRDARDVSLALAAPGDEVLIDAHVPGRPGGTGVLADVELAAQVCSARRAWLAGGLHAGNVRERLERVRPFGVDLASGVESAPGIKDPVKLEALVRAVRG